MMKFTKMNGAGNDFVMIDNRDLRLQLKKNEIARLCDRHRGIGADGLLLVEPPQNGADAKMRYYNADGGEAEMCGNGARCFARFLQSLNPSESGHLIFETMAGLISAELKNETVTINLGSPQDLALETILQIGNEEYTVHSVNTGVPHAVVPVSNVAAVDVVQLGSALRHHEHFAPAGTNVNFYEELSAGELRMRTYERGVEDETLACGTGMAACALIYRELSHRPFPVRLHVAGGDMLTVDEAPAQDDKTSLLLTGPADFVFAGEVDLPRG